MKPIKDNKSEELLKYEKFFEGLSNKRMSEVQDMAKQFDFNDLPYYFTSSNLASINYSRFKGLLIIYSEIKKW